MPTDLDSQMAPVAIKDVKGIVIDVRHRLFSFDVVPRADVPHRCLRPTDQDPKEALGDPRLGEIFFGKVVLALSDRTVNHGNVVGFGITANTTAEPASHPHSVSVFERLVGSRLARRFVGVEACRLEARS